MESVEQFMGRCLELAQRGKRRVMPNPMVGAVLVYQGKILAEGYHHYSGGPHAEVDCINKVKPEDRALIPLSTLYVSLEPCCHHGKTPPCTNLVIENKIKKVVVATLDPNPLVAGKGVQLLEEAGIQVITGIMEKEARLLNKRFITNQVNRRPYIILKWAQTADGFVAGEKHEQIKISNDAVQLINHTWRSEEAGIAVGVNTVLKDNPQLSVRHCQGINPTRLVFDPEKVLAEKDFAIFDSQAATLHLSKENNCTTWQDALHYAWNIAHLSSLIIEGGTKALQYFLDKELWDEVRIITNTTLYLESGYQAPSIDPMLMCTQTHHFGACKIEYYERFN